jgi:surface protein
MNGMFFQCGSLETLDLSGWDTRNVKDMNGMFNLCGSLETLDLSGWDTRNVKDMSVMFYNCESLGSLDLSGWDTRNVQTMYQMFFNCTQLAMLDLSSFDIQNVDSLNSIFYSCQNLTDENVIIDSTKWDLEHVMNKSDMYTGSGLSGDVSKFTQTKLKSVNLVLQDDLGLNFYVDGITDDADAENYKIVFKGECDEKGKEISLQKKTVGDQNYYYATANVSADHMDERIAAVLYKKDGKGGWERVCGNNYTVNRYLDSTPAVKEALTNEMQKVTYENLASAVRLYGEVSYAYFHDETQFTTNPPDLPEVPEPPSAIDYEPDFKNGLDDKLTLVLDSKLAVRLYIKDLQAGEKAQCDGETLTASKGSKGVFFEIKGLTPVMLGKEFTVTYADYDYKFSPLSWVYRVSENASADDKNRCMAHALHGYFKAAKIYEGVLSGAFFD